MLKRFLLAGLFFLPSVAFAQRFGGTKSGDDISLSSNTILNSSSQESKTVFVTSGTITEFNGKNISLYNTASGFGGAANLLSIVMQNSSFAPYGAGFTQTGGPLAFLNYGSNDGIALYLDDNQQMFDFQISTGGTTLHPLIASITSLQTGLPFRLYADYYFGGSYTELIATNTISNLTLYLPTEDGNPGDSLTTDGLGHLTFQTVTGTGAGPFTQAKATTSITMNGKNITSVGNLESTGTVHTTGDINADGTIGSNAGTFNIAGSTLTLDAPPTDALDRILVINGGNGEWAEMAQGADIRSTQTFSGANTFTSASGVAVTYGVVAGSVTASTTLTIPNGASPTVNATGQVALDTTDKTVIAYDGAMAFVVSHATKDFSVTISTPPGGWVGAAIPIWNAPPDMAVTIKSVRWTCMAGTSITTNIEERAFASLASGGTDIVGADVAADTNGETSVIFSNASIAAGAHLVLTPSAVSGSPDYLVVHVMYAEDVE